MRAFSLYLDQLLQVAAINTDLHYRFALTRAWFELSVGPPPSADGLEHSWLRGTVVDAQEVVPGEIWAVTLDYAHRGATLLRRETLHVLEATCEVVGRGDGGTLNESQLLVRADWSAYIARRVASVPTPASAERTSGPAPLLEHLKWPNHEDYAYGISKAWLQRLPPDPSSHSHPQADSTTSGESPRVVAERYILACVAANSVSGAWMTSSAMARAFAGLPERGFDSQLDVHRVGASAPGPRLNLYLPE